MRKHARGINATAAGLAGFMAVLPMFAPPPASGQEAFEKGKIIEKVVCRENPDQSYALYLPLNFVPTVKRPALFLFDPSARGAAAVDVFRTAAEKFGWILAASNNSRNGPVEPNMKAARMMFRDSIARLPIDETRIYSGGFSGGSRTAGLFFLAAERRVAGIIGIGAGISAGIKLEDIGTSSYFGIVGLADFNYPEMKQLDADLDGVRFPHRILFHEGPHGWPDEEACLRAIGWMEIQAIKQGSRAKDEALVDEILGKELAEASALAEAGRTFWAARQYRAVSELFDGLRDTAGSAAEAVRLEQSAAYGDFLKNEKRRDGRAASVQKDIGRAYAWIEESPEDRTGFLDRLRDLRLGSLRKEAKEARTLEDRSFALRTLFLISTDSSRKGYEYYARNDWVRASSFYELSAASCLEEDPRLKIIYLNSACAAALQGEVRAALKHLEKAVDKGFSDIQALENDKDLEKIRDTAGFRKLIERLKKIPG